MGGRTSKRPTLRTISQKSGLAIATVSRALSDASDISEDTKKRVREIAQSVGYVPNRAGLHLRTGRTNVISIVLETLPDEVEHSGQLVASIAQTLVGTPYRLNIVPHLSREDRMEPVRYLVQTQSADAVILNRTEVADVRVQFMLDQGFPFVTMGRTKWSNKHGYFDFDNATYARDAVTDLVKQGRKSLVLVSPPVEMSTTRDLISGGQSEALRLGVNFQVLPRISGSDVRTNVQTAVAALLEASPEVDGVICTSAQTAIAAALGVEASGRCIGKELDIVSKESQQFLAHFRPKIRSIGEDVSGAGRFLATAAIHSIEAPEKPPLQYLASGLAANNA